jgi:Ni/Co efflux regulator RcnB/surface antigen
MKTMKFICATGALATALLAGTSAYAQNYRDVYPGRDGYSREIRGPVYYSRGDRLPAHYRDGEYRVRDLRGNNLRNAPRGQYWVRVSNQFILINANNGLVRDVIRIEDRRPGDWGNARPNRDFPDRGPPPRIHDRDDQEARWRQRYNRAYTVESDPFYSECRNKVDPAGVIIGAVLGGLLGNAAGGRNNQTAGTVAGVFAGGALGAMLTNNLDCQDRAYAYQTYSDGFNAGRSNVSYQWRNPKNDRRGEFTVRSYYDDPDGFRCANYTQKIFIGGRAQEGTGRACRQPNGSWAMID